MKKCPIRCYRFYVEVGHRHNVEVLYPFSDFGYGTRLFQCRACQELYAVNADAENPIFVNLPEGQVPESVTRDRTCMTCGRRLSDTLVAYPQTFVTPDGIAAHHAPPMALPPDDETILREIWCISYK